MNKEPENEKVTKQRIDAVCARTRALQAAAKRQGEAAMAAFAQRTAADTATWRAQTVARGDPDSAEHQRWREGVLQRQEEDRQRKLNNGAGDLP
jgi:hypothetical protein